MQWNRCVDDRFGGSNIDPTGFGPPKKRIQENHHQRPVPHLGPRRGNEHHPHGNPFTATPRVAIGFRWDGENTIRNHSARSTVVRAWSRRSNERSAGWSRAPVP